MITFKLGDSINVTITFDTDIPTGMNIYAMFVGNNNKVFSTENGDIIQDEENNKVYYIILTNKITKRFVGNYTLEVYLKSNDTGRNALNTIDIRFEPSSVANLAIQ